MDMPLALLNRRRRGSVLNPAILFALAEPGVWYDPSDLTTLFQDTAGTQPVTAAGQTVALALDKSKGLVLGPELVTNGDFSDGLTGWTTTGTLAGGAVTIQRSADSVINTTIVYTASSSAVIGRTYLIEFDVTAGSGQFLLNEVVTANATTGRRRFYVLNTRTIPFEMRCFAGGSVTIDNISVRELSGNHATQSILASRPTYGVVPATGRRNLLTFTEQFDNAVWTKTGSGVTANAVIAPDGTTTADTLRVNTLSSQHFVHQAIAASATTSYSLTVWVKDAGIGSCAIALTQRTTGGSYTGARVVQLDLTSGVWSASDNATAPTSSVEAVTDAGNGWYKVTISGTTAATTGFVWLTVYAKDLTVYTGDGVSGVSLWGAQLETGSTPTAYQRVVSAFDVTEAGVQSLSYLSFDGIDDFLVTPTITPNTDKVQVFAGVRKLSDAATGVIAEFSADVNANVGSFYVLYPRSGTVNEPLFASRGTTLALAGASSTTFPAPRTDVLTNLGDISGDRAIQRVNGTVRVTATADQGTGNYLAYPLYIGRRGGTSLPLNGQLYSLLVRFGTNLDAGTITSTETWVNGKTGAYA